MGCGCHEKASPSQGKIARALLALMEVRPYGEISISELCRLAGVSRPTFYSFFESKDDVVALLLKESYGYTPGRESFSRTAALEDLCRAYSLYITAQRHFLALLMENHIGYLLYQSIFRSLMDCCCFLPDREPAARQYAANFTAGGLTGIVRSYVEAEPASAEALDGVLRRFFGGELFR